MGGLNKRKTGENWEGEGGGEREESRKRVEERVEGEGGTPTEWPWYPRKNQVPPNCSGSQFSTFSTKQNIMKDNTKLVF